jgi:hypothetical protein
VLVEVPEGIAGGVADEFSERLDYIHQQSEGKYGFSAGMMTVSGV